PGAGPRPGPGARAAHPRDAGGAAVRRGALARPRPCPAPAVRLPAARRGRRGARADGAARGAAARAGAARGAAAARAGPCRARGHRGPGPPRRAARAGAPPAGGRPHRRDHRRGAARPRREPALDRAAPRRRGAAGAGPAAQPPVHSRLLGLGRGCRRAQPDAPSRPAPREPPPGDDLPPPPPLRRGLRAAPGGGPRRGGDLRALAPRAAAVGMPARSRPVGADRPAGALRADGAVERLIASALPHRRSMMHLDTGTTVVDEESMLRFGLLETLETFE